MHDIQYEPYTVIRDTREKANHGWFFTPSGYCAGTTEATLETGDYSIHKYQSHLCIERKGSVVEFAQNLIQPRFEKELERMRDYPWRFVLLEFSMEELMVFPEGTHIPKERRGMLRLTGSFLLKRTLEMQQQYQTPFMFCGTKGREVCSSIFKRFMEDRVKYGKASNK